jgi:hypothetical protein
MNPVKKIKGLFMKRILKFVFTVVMMSVAGVVFAADEAAPAPAPAPAPEVKRVQKDIGTMIQNLETRIAAAKAKGVDQERITKMETTLSAMKDLQKLEADKKAMLDKDAKADTSAIDQQIKESKDKLKAMRPKGGKGGKGGAHKGEQKPQ